MRCRILPDGIRGGCPPGSENTELVSAGDFDQTIYEWRGSVPKWLSSGLGRIFQVSIYDLVETTGTRICARRALWFQLWQTEPRLPKPLAKEINCDSSASDERSEARWIAQEIKRLHRRGVPYKDIGVLCRSNKRARAVSGVLEGEQVPHITVEAYEFFRRQEVKDCMARLRFLLNSEDRVSARRILQRPASGVGDATMKRIEDAGKSGLRLTDLFSLSALDYGDPLGQCSRCTTRHSNRVRL